MFELAIGLFLIIICLLLGCSKNSTLLYSGSGENWDIEYNVTMLEGGINNNDGIYTITYIGKEEVTGTVEYKIESDFLNESGVLPLNDGKIISRTYDKYLETVDIIRFTINWNDQQETILVNKKL